LLDEWKADGASALEVVEKQSHALPQLQPISVTIPRTSALIQMMDKIFNQPLVQGIDWSAFLTYPIDEVFRSSEVSARGYLGIAHLIQLFSEIFK
jgi:hypothetical protein